MMVEFSTGHFETTDTCSAWSVDVHVVSELSYIVFFLLFIYLFLSTFTTFST